MSVNSPTVSTETTMDQTLEAYFEAFRKQIIGNDQEFDGPYGRKKIYYADWTASGRLYAPIEKILRDKIAPFVGNTHTETTVTGCTMTLAYHKAKEIIKKHVNAGDHDVLISGNSGMTGVVNKFQRILGFRIHEKYKGELNIAEEDRPIVFITHMEHHSNQTTWLETICDVEIIDACGEGKVCLDHFRSLCTKYANRKHKIAAVTSCSNVTGIVTPYHEIAEIIHEHKGLCFVDFACSAPYIDIDMHPANPAQKLDAIYFSPHKFLGGPGSSGILIFCRSLYTNKIPDNPGGGTVDWTNPWGGHKYYDSIEAREDGGTPAFLQTMRVAFCIQLKEQMGVDKMMAREEELLTQTWAKIGALDNLHILASHIKERLCVISFYIEEVHFNLAVKLLNDRYGVQVRGGCSCAGTYGHYLLKVSHEKSKRITDAISKGILADKPGWVRMSLHPTMTDADLNYILDAVVEVSKNAKEWAADYFYDDHKNEWLYKGKAAVQDQLLVDEWFDSSLV